MNKARLLDLLRGDSIKLSPAEGKIAGVVLEDPHLAIHQPIARLARSAGVSEPTVNRLCRKLGCHGYPDFKLRLAQELSSSSHLFAGNVDAGDDTAAIMAKILSSIEHNVRSVSQWTSPGSIEQAAALLESSKSISFFGAGASGPVALDAQHKFFRFGIPVVAHTDVINQRMLCSMLGADDSAVFISYTGRTRAILESAELARGRGVRTIGLTRNDSPLGGHCQVVLNAVTREDTDLFTPMTSRIIQLALIDILATRVAMDLGERVEANIRTIKSNLRDTRVSSTGA